MEAYRPEVGGDELAACDRNEGTRVIAVRFEVSESRVRRIKQQRREKDQFGPRTAAVRQPKWLA